MRVHRILPLLAFVILAACGSTSTATNGTTSTGGATTTTPAGSSASTSKLPAHLCDLLPIAQIEMVTGVKVNGPPNVREDGANGARQRLASCAYSLSDATFDNFTFSFTQYDTSENAHQIYTTLSGGDANGCKPISGLGDEACVRSDKIVELDVHKGVYYIVLSRGPAGDLTTYPAQLQQLARSVLSQV